MTSKNADYDELFPCTADGVSIKGHKWSTVPHRQLSNIVECARCRIVHLPPAVTGEDLLPHGPYEIPNAHATRTDAGIVSGPHIMKTVGDAYDAFRTAPGNRDGSYPTRRHFVATLTAGGMDKNEATRLYDRNRHSIMEFHWKKSTEVAQVLLV